MSISCEGSKEGGRLFLWVIPVLIDRCRMKVDDKSQLIKESSQNAGARQWPVASSSACTPALRHHSIVQTLPALAVAAELPARVEALLAFIPVRSGQVNLFREKEIWPFTGPFFPSASRCLSERVDLASRRDHHLSWPERCLKAGSCGGSSPLSRRLQFLSAKK